MNTGGNPGNCPCSWVPAFAGTTIGGKAQACAAVAKPASRYTLPRNPLVIG
jgi:hypothetical protein